MNQESEAFMAECRAKLAEAASIGVSDLETADGLVQEARNKMECAVGLDRRDQDFGAISLAEKRAERVREGMADVYDMLRAQGKVA